VRRRIHRRAVQRAAAARNRVRVRTGDEEARSAAIDALRSALTTFEVRGSTCAVPFVVRPRRVTFDVRGAARQTTNDKRRTTNDERRTANDEPEPSTPNRERRTGLATAARYRCRCASLLAEPGVFIC